MSELQPVSAAKVQQYEKTRGVFDGLIKEVREISRKKPDSTLSKYKVALINRVLADLQGLLSDSPEKPYLDLLEDEQLPQLSDAVMVMVQYEAALDAMKERHYGWLPSQNDHDWYIRG